MDSFVFTIVVLVFLSFVESADLKESNKKLNVKRKLSKAGINEIESKKKKKSKKESEIEKIKIKFFGDEFGFYDKSVLEFSDVLLTSYKYSTSFNSLNKSEENTINLTENSKQSFDFMYEILIGKNPQTINDLTDFILLVSLLCLDHDKNLKRFCNIINSRLNFSIFLEARAYLEGIQSISLKVYKPEYYKFKINGIYVFYSPHNSFIFSLNDIDKFGYLEYKEENCIILHVDVILVLHTVDNELESFCKFILSIFASPKIILLNDGLTSINLKGIQKIFSLVSPVELRILEYIPNICDISIFVDVNELPRLKRLHIRNNILDLKALKNLQSLKKLEIFELDSCKIIKSYTDLKPSQIETIDFFTVLLPDSIKRISFKRMNLDLLLLFSLDNIDEIDIYHANLASEYPEWHIKNKKIYEKISEVSICQNIDWELILNQTINLSNMKKIRILDCEITKEIETILDGLEFLNLEHLEMWTKMLNFRLNAPNLKTLLLDGIGLEDPFISFSMENLNCIINFANSNDALQNFMHIKAKTLLLQSIVADKFLNSQNTSLYEISREVETLILFDNLGNSKEVDKLVKIFKNLKRLYIINSSVMPKPEFYYKLEHNVLLKNIIRTIDLKNNVTKDNKILNIISSLKNIEIVHFNESQNLKILSFINFSSVKKILFTKTNLVTGDIKFLEELAKVTNSLYFDAIFITYQNANFKGRFKVKNRIKVKKLIVRCPNIENPHFTFFDLFECVKVVRIYAETFNINAFKEWNKYPYFSKSLEEFEFYGKFSQYRSLLEIENDLSQFKKLRRLEFTLDKNSMGVYLQGERRDGFLETYFTVPLFDRIELVVRLTKITNSVFCIERTSFMDLLDYVIE